MSDFKTQVLAARPAMDDWDGEKAQYAEEKHNGHSVTIIKDPSGSVCAVGKKPTIDLWPKLRLDGTLEEIVAQHLVCGTALMGEVYVPDGFSTDVPTALNAGDGWRFSPFAVPFHGGKSWAGQDLLFVRACLEELGFTVPRLFPIATREKMLAAIRRERLEGYVLKGGHLRPWYKLKPVKTVDCIVVGWTPGVGKFEGMVGSFDVACVVEQKPDGELMVQDIANVGVGTNGSLDDDVRRALDGDACMNRVMEVVYQNVGAGGRLIFPRFLRWRDDKPAEDCKMAQLQ